MKYVIFVSYEGKNYSGWQVQPNKNTIQGQLQNAISQVLKCNVELVASGRTDAGVSALKQVAHFETDALVSRSFVSYCNHILPADIRILSLNKADNSFHARYCAKRKTYCYNFYISNISIPWLNEFCLQVPESVNLDILKQEAKSFVGTHNFSAFCASNGSAKNMVRTIYSAEIIQNGNVISFVVTGNGFLYNMVRIMAGTLIDIARGKITKSVKEIIESENRSYAGKTAGSVGLLLLNVEY